MHNNYFISHDLFCIQGPEAHAVPQTSPNVKARFARKRGRHPVKLEVDELATQNAEPSGPFEQGTSPATQGHVDGGGQMSGLPVHSGDTPKAHTGAGPGGASKRHTQDGEGNDGGGERAVEKSTTAQTPSSVGGRRNRKANLDPAFLP
jgi:hypothetical protein